MEWAEGAIWLIFLWGVLRLLGNRSKRRRTTK